MPYIKGTIEKLKDKVKDIGDDIKQIPQDIKDFGEKKLSPERPIQALEDYGIEIKNLTQQELLETLIRFQKNRKNGGNSHSINEKPRRKLTESEKINKKIDEQIKQIPERLITALDRENFPIDLNKIDDLFSKYNRRQELNLTEKEIFDNLSSQDILSMQLFNYNYSFWHTQIKDGNDIKYLTPYIPKKPRLNDSEEQIKNPNNQEPKNEKEFNKEENISKQSKKQQERTGKIKRTEDVIKTFIDLGPLDKPTKILFINILNSLIESVGCVGAQHIIEMVKRPNLLDMSPEEEDSIAHILTDAVFHGGKHIILLNHDTFANIPLAIIKFMKVAIKRFNIEDINKYFTTMIGPLIAVHKKQKRRLNVLSNVQVTHPINNKIHGANIIEQIVKNNASTQMDKDLAENNEIGQIYFIAPSGTRDIVNFANDGSSQIIIPDESWGSNMATFRKIRTLYSKNHNIKLHTLSTNTSDVKRPKGKVSMNNNERPVNATASMHLRNIKTNNFSEEDFAYGLSKLLQDKKYAKLNELPPMEVAKMIENDISIQQTISEYIIQRNLSSEYIMSSIGDNITYPIPTNIYKSKNPIKNRRNRGKKIYEYSNGEINETKCVVYTPPIIFEYLKRFTKQSKYTQTGRLPKIFLNKEGKIDIDENSIIKLDKEEFRLLLQFAKTKEYRTNRKIPSRLFNEKGFININLLKSEIENLSTKQSK